MIVEPATESIKDKISFSRILDEIKIEKVSNDARTLAKKYGYLPYMVERYLEILGYDETLELLETFDNYKYKPIILCNNLRIDCKVLIEKLLSLNFEIEEIPWNGLGFIVKKQPRSPTLGSTHEYLKGYYYIYRDIASLIPTMILAPTSYSKVLDMCAAPGGKASHILILMKDRGLLVANDISKKRLQSLIVNFYRMGFSSYILTLEDGRLLPKKLRLKFDYVLLDAPCSAEGAIMFDKTRKFKTSQEALAKLVLKEIELLVSAINIAKPGARIVYTTCSIAPEENEYVITKVFELLGENVLEIEYPSIDLGDRGLNSFKYIEFHPKISRCIRVWPHRHSMEGYFVCVMRKL